MHFNPAASLYETAKVRCELEGAQLAYILSDSMQKAITATINEKRARLDYFADKDVFWLAGSFIEEEYKWNWDSHEQSFYEYMNWEAKTVGMQNIFWCIKHFVILIFF